MTFQIDKNRVGIFILHSRVNIVSSNVLCTGKLIKKLKFECLESFLWLSQLEDRVLLGLVGQARCVTLDILLYSDALYMKSCTACVASAEAKQCVHCR